MSLRPFATALAVIIALTADAGAQTATDPVSIRTVFWNMQSGNSDNALLASQIEAKQNVDIWGFSEVDGQSALTAFHAAAERGGNARYEAVLGLGGCGGDRLGIVFNAEVVELVSAFELHQLGGGCQRAPLVAHFRGQTTGMEFFFVTNHLARGNAAFRLTQAEGLADWLGSHDMPTIRGGDLNADYHIDLGDQGQRDPAFDALVEDGPYVWVRPDPLVKTEDSDNFRTVLDFVLAGNIPMGWTGTSTILKREGDEPATAIDFDDNAQETDHRPVDAVFEFSPDLPCGVDDECPEDTVTLSREELPERIDALEAELSPLRDMAATQ